MDVSSFSALLYLISHFVIIQVIHSGSLSDTCYCFTDHRIAHSMPVRFLISSKIPLPSPKWYS